jgi:DivIVA domain-containing protein
MEISARILKEVEFNSSLRGYNTDEVDEFLEQVAAAVERLQAEARAASERADEAERGARDKTGIEDDDSIRRTLVLAQRTADLAIKEAHEEASEIVDRARVEAQTLVNDARDSAERMTSDAERRLREEVGRLTAKRDELRTEADTLVSLLTAERDRLTETLGAALRYVERSLSPSAALLAPPAEDAPLNSGAAPGGGDKAAQTPDDTRLEVVPDGGDDDEDEDEDAPEPLGHAGPSDAVDDVEAAIAEDAAAAAPSPPSASRRTADEYDWDSVIRGRSEPQFGDRLSRTERPNLTSVPPRADSLQDTAAWQIRVRGADSPA